MKFGLMQDFRNPRPWFRPYGELYRLLIDQCVRAEELGYDNIWLTEHHFSGDYNLGEPASSVHLAIPATLQDSLMARLDRLGPAKELAQLGATIGREFRYELLQAVSLLNETTLQARLHNLVEAELVYQRGAPPRAQYTFKHALIQDTAYQSLLKSTRQQYHQQIARTLEERFAEIKESQPELLAHQYTEAGQIE